MPFFFLPFNARVCVRVYVWLCLCVFPWILLQIQYKYLDYVCKSPHKDRHVRIIVCVCCCFCPHWRCLFLILKLSAHATSTGMTQLLQIKRVSEWFSVRWSEHAEKWCHAVLQMCCWNTYASEELSGKKGYLSHLRLIVTCLLYQYKRPCASRFFPKLHQSTAAASIHTHR